MGGHAVPPRLAPQTLPFPPPPHLSASPPALPPSSRMEFPESPSGKYAPTLPVEKLRPGPHGGGEIPEVIDAISQPARRPPVKHPEHILHRNRNWMWFHLVLPPQMDCRSDGGVCCSRKKGLPPWREVPAATLAPSWPRQPQLHAPWVWCVHPPKPEEAPSVARAPQWTQPSCCRPLPHHWLHSREPDGPGHILPPHINLHVTSSSSVI